MKHGVFGFLAVVLLLTGCATSSMKGTPFYTGEYDVREGPAADRVNVWPIAYYRDPALSVLWPLMEFSPDHLALRPVYSVYGRESDFPVYNVVWPIGRFDTRHKDYQIFPVYWGDDYFTLFPFYWNKGEPFSGVGYNALFPLWIWNSGEDGNSLDVLWPLCAKKQYPDRQEWRIFPLAGSSNKDGKLHAYYAWPFAHRWADGTNVNGHTVFPLYLRNRSGTRDTVASLPYSRSVTSVPEAKSWDLTLPLMYRSWRGDTFGWSAIPLLSWGARDGESSDSWYALGLGRYSTSADGSASHVMPFYYYSRNPLATSCYTLPWWSKTKADGSGWHTSIPFYYRGYSAGDSAFYSLPWWSEMHADGSAWQASFPFYYGSSSTNGSLVMTPLYARKLQADGAPAWRCFIPIVYLDNTKDAHFLTLLGGHWRLGDQSSWLALPLLSGGSKSADAGHNIWLAGLAGQQWAGNEKSHYVFPLYYTAPESDKFLSLPYATWPSGDRQNHFALPLLSFWSTSGDATRAILAAGLAGFRSGGNGYHYLLPFYYAAADGESFVSLPYAQWSKGDRQSWMIPFLLSGKSVENNVEETVLLGGLARWKTEGPELQTSHLLPFYAWSKDRYFYTALYGKNAGMEYYATPLAGRYGDDAGASGSWVFPLYRHKRTAEDTVRGSYLLLGHYKSDPHHALHGFYGLYRYDWRETFTRDENPRRLGERKDISYLCSLGQRSERRDYAAGGGDSEPVLRRYRKTEYVFPFWAHEIYDQVAVDDRLETSSLLGVLYDSRHEQKQGDKPHDYLRRRVLWRLYHHEKLNGDASTDIFPSITVDSCQNGYYKYSFLWRFFRYENDPETGRKKLDLLFVPLRR